MAPAMEPPVFGLEELAMISASPSPQWTPGSPPPAPRRPTPTLLLKAIQSGSAQQVSAFLEISPERATCDETLDPPLCTAIEIDLNKEIVRTLLSFNADVNCFSCDGRNPLQILLDAVAYRSAEDLPSLSGDGDWTWMGDGSGCGDIARLGSSFAMKEIRQMEDDAIAVASILLAAGARLEEEETGMKHAQGVGCRRLDQFLKFYAPVQSYFVISRAMRPKNGAAMPCQWLRTDDLLSHVFCFLLPEEIENALKSLTSRL
ncbi:unnamed protein product [Effrenium voratum]|uniref:Uncharacterized protein n=1 Tax=Effrenium voratum TaxID=2562239 RepID=A0AA36IC86_9DINO|nr:unnamed protein product [Effrenium voratum]